MAVDLSIVIVNYKVPHFAEQCLHALYRSVGTFTWEVWLVDNHSQDDSVARLRASFPAVHYIENQENLGFAKANNLAIRRAQGRYILLLNPDTVVGETTLSRCIEAMESHPRWGGLGLKMLNARGSFLPESKRGFPTPWVAFAKMSSLYRLAPRSRWLNRYYWGHTSSEEMAEVEVLSGAFMFLRREALDKAGLLDEDFFMYGEDIDLSYRILLSGYSLGYIPTPIIHYKGEAEHASQNRERYIRSFYGAMQIFYAKHPSRFRLWSQLVLSAIGILKRIQLWRAKRRSDRSRTALPSPKVAILTPEWNDHSAWRQLPDACAVQVDPSLVGYDALLERMQSTSPRDIEYHLWSPLSGEFIVPQKK